jgi:integrase
LVPKLKTTQSGRTQDMPNLTKALVEKLEPQEKDYAVWDAKISGFGVRIAPTGRKTYIMKYRTPEGRQRRRKIGVHGNITCEKARSIAGKWHGSIADNVDPTEQITEVKNSPTISDLCDRFIKEHAEIRKKESGLELDKAVIKNHIKPHLGNLKTVSVKKADIQKFHLGLKDIPAHANRILRVLSKMFNLAEDWGLRPANSNPVTNIERYKEDPRERYLSGKELTALGKILDEIEHDGSESIHFISLIRLLLLTGARLREIMHAKWEWVHSETGLLMLPDSKTGKKIIHLSPAALQVLKNTPRIKGNPYIIVGGKEGQPLISPKKPWMRVKERTAIELLRGHEEYGELIKTLERELKTTPTYEELCKEAKKQKLDEPVSITDVRMHDLRHTYASICVGQGMSIQMVAKLLGHSQTRTSERYAHLAHNPVSNAAADIGDSISSLITNGNNVANEKR